MAKKKANRRKAAVPNDTLKKGAFLAAYVGCGNITEAADKASIGRKTHFRWMREDPEYPERFREARSMAADIMEGEARRRATEGAMRFKFHEGRQIMVVSPASIGPNGEMIGGKLVPYVEYQKSDTLLIFMLKALRPKKFRDNVKVENTGSLDVRLTGENSPLPSPEEALKRYAEFAARLPAKPIPGK